LDKDENRKQEEVKTPQTQKPFSHIELPIALEYNNVVKDLLNQIEDSHASAVIAIDEDSRSIFSNKKILLYVMNLVNISHEMSRYSIISAFAVDYVNRKLEVVEKAVQFLIEKTKRLPTKADLKKLKKISKQLTDIDAVMQNVKVMAEKEKEVAEAVKKIDKDRQEVLRDSLV